MLFVIFFTFVCRSKSRLGLVFVINLYSTINKYSVPFYSILIIKFIFVLNIIFINILAMFAVVYYIVGEHAVTNVVRTCSPTPLSTEG